MKTFHYYFACFAAGLLIATSRGQAFQNLDFEQGSISIPPPAQVSTSVALPGWRVYLNGSQSSTIVYDTIALDLWGVSIHDSNSFMPPISGRFSVYLEGGRNAQNVQGNAEIAQTGTIDQTARSLLFTATRGVPNVSFDGQPLPVFPLQNHNTFTSYVADISAFAGQTGELRFTTPYPTGSFLDDIQFSTQVIPEPSTFALLAAGAAVFGAALNRRRK